MFTDVSRMDKFSFDWYNLNSKLKLNYMELEDQVFSQGTFETDGYFEHIKGFEDAIEKFV